MSRLFGALLGALLSISAVQADTVTRAAPPSLFIAPNSAQVLPQDAVPRLSALMPARFAKTENTIAGTVDTQADINAFGFACGATVSVTPKAGALLDVAISAPCKPDEQVTITHAGLSFDVMLSLTGSARVLMPAMTKRAEIDTIFEDQTRLTRTVNSPDLKEYARLAVGWADDHAQLEGLAPRHLPVTAFQLGHRAGRTVQIVSHHIDPDSRAGVIRMSIHAQVNAQNCNLTQRADVVAHQPHHAAQSYTLELLQPGCDRVGDNLVLKNILPDLKLATN